jgi:ubiquinone/menaquinone biosynthesis C-methylase UbiE
MHFSKFPLVQSKAIFQYNKALLGETKVYPSLELVRIEKIFLNGNNKKKLLEVGFGGGCNTIHLIKSGYNLTGIDVAKNAKKVVIKKLKSINFKKKIDLKILNPKAKKLPFDDNAFDIIVAMSILSLLGSEKKINNLLKELKRVLKPGGKIILDINAQNSEFSLGKKIRKNIYLTKIQNRSISTFCLKTKNEFKKLVKKYFKIIDLGYTSFRVFDRKITEFIICGTN